MESRPKAVELFLKNGHNYEREYGLEVHSLGREISTWWGEIKAAVHIGYGGTTGIHILIVLMTWWCKLLRNEPDSERAKYVAIVKEQNRTLLDALHSMDQSQGVRLSATDSLPTALPAAPRPNNRPAKRASFRVASSRKRTRI